MILDNIISKEIEKLKELESVLDLEKEALMKSEGDKIPDILEKKQQIMKEMHDIEVERIKISGEVSARDCVKNGQLDNKICEGFINIVNRIKQKSETNMVLTKQSLTYIRTISNILRPGQPIVTYNNYGQVGDGEKKPGLFTAKV